MEKTLTVIIPSYNSAKTIETALNSFDFIKNKDIDVLIVDDGSKDNTEVIINHWIKRFPEQIKYVKKENGNWGSVLNYALKHINSRFARTLDSDDYFEKTDFDKFIDNLRMLPNNIDIVLTGYNFVNNNGTSKQKRKIIYTQNNKDVKITSIGNSSLYLKTLTVHSLTFSKNIISKIPKIPENVFYSDNFFIFNVFLNARIAAIIPNLYLYNYVIGNTEQSISINTTKKNINHMETVYKAITETKVPLGLPKNQKKILGKLIRYMFYWNALNIAIQDNMTNEEKQKEIMKLFNILKKNQDKKFYRIYVYHGFMLIIRSIKAKSIPQLIKVFYKILPIGFIKSTKPPKTKKNKAN